jgi:glutamate synthase domain-containing protein 1
MKRSVNSYGYVGETGMRRTSEKKYTSPFSYGEVYFSPHSHIQQNSDSEVHIPSGCGISGIMNQRGRLFSGEAIYDSICNMKERGNGLGSGYAAYGIYPEFKDYWCFHIMYQKSSAKDETEEYLRKNFNLIHKEPIPTKRVKTLRFVPILWRYFLEIKREVIKSYYERISDEDYIIKCVMDINKEIEDAFVFSSGKNMGIFKGVGDPDEIGEFYRIPEYKGYIWTAHNRFPTNTVGWWGGAHPFGILDWSVVHNGEISSYGINRRYLENFGYYCTLFTDTEVMAYLFDLLVRRHNLDFEVVGNILASPFWTQIERIEDKAQREFLKTLRMVYGSALVNGPFAVIVANSNYMVGLNDRIKLRPLVAATKGDFLYIASEEAAIKIVCKNPDKVWMPRLESQQ